MELIMIYIFISLKNITVGKLQLVRAVFYLCAQAVTLII
jgi:hypothetical protein